MKQSGKEERQGEGRMPTKERWALPDFALILSIEQMLSACPFSHYKLQGRFASRSWEAAQELQEGFQLSVHQMSEHHDQRLGGNKKDVCFRETNCRDLGMRGNGASQSRNREHGDFLVNISWARIDRFYVTVLQGQ